MESDMFEDILECPVCLKTLDQHNKVLPCQHTFCTSCLNHIVKSQKQLCCPECRILVEKPVKELPSNIMLNRILDGLREKQVTEKQKVAHVNRAVPPKVHPTGKSKPHLNESPRKYSPPMCVALYDFHNKDKTIRDPNCLNFKKNDIIIATRLVDQHWAEGKHNDKIGIFPLSYVKLNDAAKGLLSGGNRGGKTEGSHIREHPKPTERSTRDKANPSHRFSLPPENNLADVRQKKGRTGKCGVPLSMEIKPSSAPPRKEIHSAARLPTTRVTLSVAAAGNASRQDGPNRHFSSSDMMKINSVLALYPYKPQKPDELELVKGDRYQVIEVCNDGWCRGRHEATNKCGVFPGNFTQPIGPGKKCLLKAAPFHWSSPAKPVSKLSPEPIVHKTASPLPKSKSADRSGPALSSKMPERAPVKVKMEKTRNPSETNSVPQSAKSSNKKSKKSAKGAKI